MMSDNDKIWLIVGYVVGASTMAAFMKEQDFSYPASIASGVFWPILVGLLTF